MANTDTSASTFTSMMRVTSNGTPFAKDLFDLFAALLVQLPLGDHRVLLRVYHSSFTSEEAIERLANLTFTHVARVPDPNDPSRLVTTRTTTTFNMSGDMARILGQQFLNARLMENATDPQNRSMKDKGIWTVTPKGKFMIQHFSQRARIDIQRLATSLSTIESFRVFAFERFEESDGMALSRPNLTNAFKTMLAWLPTEMLMADDVGGLRDKEVHEYQYTFYAYQCIEWLLEYTTVVSRTEAEMIASEFVLYGWVKQVLDKSDRVNSVREDQISFKNSRNTIYYVTEKGCAVLGWKFNLADNQDAETIRSGSSSSLPSQEKESLTKRQLHHANRLLSTDNQSTSDTESHTETIPHAKVTRQQVAIVETYPTESDDTESKTTTLNDDPLETDTLDMSGATCNFSFVTNPFTDPSDASVSTATEPDMLAPCANIDEVTERLLRLRCQPTYERQRYVVARRSGSSATTSFDSGCEVLSTKSRRTLSYFETESIASGEEISRRGNLLRILEDPLRRVYFRDFMKTTLCEENLNFWVAYANVRKKVRQGGTQTRELLSDCYAIYDLYLREDASSEINIDHALRQEIATLITDSLSVTSSGGHGNLPFSTTGNAVQPIQTTIVVNVPTAQCLKALLKLYERANDRIVHLMELDTLARYLKSVQYRESLIHQQSRRELEARQLLDDKSKDNLSSDDDDEVQEDSTTTTTTIIVEPSED